jgi:hypothetical protein
MTDVSTSPVVRHGIEAGAGSSHAAPGAAGWLGLAAAPTFVLMALWTGVSTGQPDVLCMQNASPTSGMTTMYLLMAVFHVTPWLRALSNRLRCSRLRDP